MKKRPVCTNDPVKKAVEIAIAIGQLGNADPRMAELYRRGCFRHAEDVAFARIMLSRNWSVDAIAVDLDASYEGPKAVVKHRCDRVFPPN